MNGISRSLLFVPGNRPERFEKAAASGAHEIVIDLEDAVAPAAKVEAREAAAAWLAAGQQTTIRINSAETEWFEDDVAMLSAYPTAVVMVPKADADSLTQVSTTLPNRSMIALIETVCGFMDIRQLWMVAGVKRFAFGSVDFGVESGIEDTGDAMTAIRTQIVLESCYGGLEAPIDGVSVNFNDDVLMQRDATRSRQLGFGGKLCIHPKQVSVVNDAYRPTVEQVDWARRVLIANEQSQGGATTVDGKMIDKPVVMQAQKIVADANR